MLTTTKLNNCPGCKDLSALIDELDCYLAGKGLTMLNNLRYSLTSKVCNSTMRVATRYRDILIARSYNPNYISEFSIADITNKVKQIIYGM